jgi:hypothetical protein
LFERERQGWLARNRRALLIAVLILLGAPLMARALQAWSSSTIRSVRFKKLEF